MFTCYLLKNSRILYENTKKPVTGNLTLNLNQMNKQNSRIWTRSFISLSLASLLVYTAFYFLLPTLPLYLIQVLKAGPGFTGIILAAYTVAALLIRPATGFLIDRYGRKMFYLAGLAVFSLIFGTYAFATSLLAILFFRFFHGLLWGISTTTANTLAVDLVPPERRGEGLGYFGLSTTIPMAIGPFIGLQLVSGGNYRLMFLTAVIVSLSGLFIALSMRFPKMPVHTVRFSFRNLFEKSSLPVSLTLLLTMISYGGVVSFVSLYARETGSGNAGLFFILYASGIFIARLGSGRIFDRKGPLLLSVTGLCCLVSGFLVLALLKNQAGFLGSALILGTGVGVLVPTFQAMINNLAEPHRRGAANSTLFTALDLGIGTGMILIGYLAGKTGLSAAFLVCSLLNALALLFFLLISMKHYQIHSAKHPNQ